MKVRNDFVSNSSSSSFIVLKDDDRDCIFDAMRNRRLMYQEFRHTLDYYRYIVFKYNDEYKNIVNKFLNFVKTSDCDKIVAMDVNSELWDNVREYMRSIFSSLPGVSRVKSQRQDSLLRKYVPSYVSYDYFYNGEKLDLLDSDAIENKFGFKTGYKYVVLTSSGESRNGSPYVLEPFICSLADDEYKAFKNSILAMFERVEGDGYGSDDTRPPELLVFEKYN